MSAEEVIVLIERINGLHDKLLKEQGKTANLENDVRMLEDNSVRTDAVLDYMMQTVDKLKAERDKLLALLRKIEWCCEDDNGYDICPYCQNRKQPGHSCNCIIGNALKESG